MPHGRRRQLVDHGVELALSQRVQDLVSGVETASISEAAGVTTGSFFHHFRNRGHFADAVAQRFLDCWQERIDRLLDTSEGVVAEPGPASFRQACAVEWSRLREMTGTAGLQHLLWVARAQPIGDETSITAGDVLGDAYRRLVSAVQPLYDRGMAAMGREALPPFDHVDLAVALTAMAEGLQRVDAVAPDLLRDDLYADVMTALFIGLTRPRVERAETTPPVELGDLESRLGRGAAWPPPPTSRERVETWRQIADAAAHLFVDRSPGDVRVADVAQVAGVSTSTVYHQFGTVWAVAAAGFARHVPELAAIAGQPLTAQEGPVLRIEQVLVRYVELVKANRGAAEALAAQSVTALGPRDRARRGDVHGAASVADTLVDLVHELRVRGLLRRRIDSERLARSLIHLTTMQTLGFPDDPVERIVDETITLVLEGALVGSAQD